MDKDVIEITVDLKFVDFWRPLFWQHFRQLWIIYLVAAVISIPALVFVSYALLARPDAKFTPALILPLLPVFIVALDQWAVYSSAQRSVDAVKSKISWQFSTDGYTTSTAMGRADCIWDSLAEIQEKNKEFLLFPQKPIFIVLPKRSFAGEVQIREFRSLILKEMGSRAKLKK
jgi:hypothetical protein